MKIRELYHHEVLTAHADEEASRVEAWLPGKPAQT